MSNVFFTADTHLGHQRIISHCSRPFGTWQEMDEVIISRINSLVTHRDTLYHLGDVAWSTFNVRTGFFDRLHCKQVHLILGNHDEEKRFTRSPIHGLVWVGNGKSISIDKQRVVMLHYPMRSWNGKGHGAFHLYGHCHGNLPGMDRSLDVGVDCNNFYPFEWSEIKDRLDKIDYFDSEKNTGRHRNTEVVK